MKMSCGPMMPESSGMPAADVAGKMTNPAMRAMSVSMAMTLSAVFGRFVSFLK